ncbi:MAG TPA: hypothetical protein VKZ42_03135, partial [Flavobacteriaceae bacterium]|nr:hypothetical protein [Flavobacteriaceae bacterium]
AIYIAARMAYSQVFENIIQVNFTQSYDNRQYKTVLSYLVVGKKIGTTNYSSEFHNLFKIHISQYSLSSSNLEIRTNIGSMI